MVPIEVGVGNVRNGKHMTDDGIFAGMVRQWFGTGRNLIRRTQVAWIQGSLQALFVLIRGIVVIVLSTAREAGTSIRMSPID